MFGKTARVDDGRDDERRVAITRFGKLGAQVHFEGKTWTVMSINHDILKVWLRRTGERNVCADVILLAQPPTESKQE